MKTAAISQCCKSSVTLIQPGDVPDYYECDRCHKNCEIVCKNAERMAEEWCRDHQADAFGVYVDPVGGATAAYLDGYKEGHSDACKSHEGTAEYRLGFERGHAEARRWIKTSEEMPPYDSLVNFREESGAIHLGRFKSWVSLPEQPPATLGYWEEIHGAWTMDHDDIIEWYPLFNTAAPKEES